MLISGKEKLERMRDGRVIYIGAERVRAAHALRALLCRQFDHRAQSERSRGAVEDIPCHGGRAAGTRADAQFVAIIHPMDCAVERTPAAPRGLAVTSAPPRPACPPPTIRRALELAHDLGHGLIDALRLDRTLAQRDLDRAQQLVSIERHAAAVALDDHKLAQLHALECGKAEIAAQTHATAADDGGILGRPRVFDLRIEAAAIRTTHGRPLRSRNHSWARLNAASLKSITTVDACDRPVVVDCGSRADARSRNSEGVAIGPMDLSLDKWEIGQRAS